MNNIATIVVNPEITTLDQSALDRALRTMENAGAETGAPAWLSAGEAVDIPFIGANVRTLQDALSAALPGSDVICQETSARRKKLLVADMDSTIITIECIDEIAAMLGIKDKVAKITEAAMRGELDFKGALRERVAMLEGLEEGRLQEVYDTRLSFSPGAAELIGTFRTMGGHSLLVSGGFTYFADKVRDALGFWRAVSNQLEILDGKLSGRVEGSIVDGARKLDLLRAAREELGLEQDEVLGLGDGANDIPFLQEAGLGLAYNAKPATMAAADAAISHTGLTSALFAQGVHRDAFRVYQG